MTRVGIVGFLGREATILAWFGDVEVQVDRIQPLSAKVEVRPFFLQPLRLLGIIFTHLEASMRTKHSYSRYFDRRH